MANTALSPMMEQYFKVKSEHLDHLLFYRVGDFYEMFYDDALIASKELDLVLTGKDCGQTEKAPMCGVPHHACQNYIARLVKKGYKVAICEQVEDPKFAKGIVKRDVIRVYTPGTILEDEMLDEGKNNYISCVYSGTKNTGICFADISTGIVYATVIKNNKKTDIDSEMARFKPSEVITNCDYPYSDLAKLVFEQFNSITVESIELNYCVGSLIKYLEETQKSGIERLINLNIYNGNEFMHLDSSAIRNLELTETMRGNEKYGSLLWAIDNTKTAMGRRLLRRFIEQPLCNQIEIEKRLNAVDEIFNNSMLRMDLGESLKGIYDLERLLSRIVYGSTTPREMLSLYQTLTRIPRIKELLKAAKSNFLKELYLNLDTLEDVSEKIFITINPNPPALMKDGHYIKVGFSNELDELRNLLSDTKSYLAQIETDEKEKTGIKTLRIVYSKVFGYAFEVSNSFKDQVPENYIRKQTLVNGERFITPELKELEDKIFNASTKQLQLEEEIFNDLRKFVSSNTERIQNSANILSLIDVLYSFSETAITKNYTRPIITNNGQIIIKDGRHPVVEEILTKNNRFVANDTLLDCDFNKIAIITGPNMAGKSTYIRQVAIITLMAQIGSFVPASHAEIGLVDGIYTRVGASDDLATGQSTFMVEMNEVANILKNATKNSLIILDEVGRGTSTFDGMSIARAIIEYIADSKKIGAKTLFATHYHELTELENTISCVKNYNTVVKKRGDDITFLRRIVRGSVDESYGIEVSKLAGIPDVITNRAKEILRELKENQPFVTENKDLEENIQLGFDNSSSSAIVDAVKDLDIDSLTPLEALNKLYEFKSML